jgi:cyclophilin family peptidyl-prolyl cis-trans isomerase
MRMLCRSLALSLLLAGCAEDGRGPEDLPGETVRGWEQESSDAGVASIQRQIRRRVASGEIDPSKPNWLKEKLPLRPTAKFDAAKTYFWVLDTSEGTLRIRLRPGTAPEHVSNVVYLSLLGFFDGLPFYSVVPGKSAASGDPRGDGTGSPGFTLTGPELDPAAKHDRRGLVSAVSLGPGTDDSKFRILFAPDSSLDEHGTIFGEVVEGDAASDVLARIEGLGTPEGDPTKPVFIRSATLVVR